MSDFPFPLRLGIAVTVVVALPWNTAVGQRREVFPRRYASATKEGGTFYQLLHLSKATPQPPLWSQVLFRVDALAAGTVTAIAFRPATLSANPPTTPAFTVDVELGFGHSARKVSRPSLYVKQNRGNDFAIVVKRKSLNFPSLPARKTGPYPFAYRIPFDRPGHLSAGRTGMWELRVYNSTLTFQQFQSVGVDSYASPFDPKDPRYARTLIGASCTEFQVGASVMAPDLAAEAYTFPLIYGFGRLSRAFIYAGFSETRWSGLKLPFDLTPLGAPGCKIHTSLDVLLPVVPELTVATGVVAALDLPNLPSLVGKHFYLQAIALRVARTPLGIVTSSGLKVRIGPRLDVVGSTVLIPAMDRYDLGWWRLGFLPVFELTVQ